MSTLVNFVASFIIIGLSFSLFHANTEKSEVLRVNNELANLNQSTNAKIDSLGLILSGMKDFLIPKTITRLTAYWAVEEQTDSTPDRTADQTRFYPQYASRYKFCAVSRDLLSTGFVEYGDFILVPEYGIFQVRDTMNRRFTNTVDLLTDKGTWIKNDGDIIIFKIKHEHIAQFNSFLTSPN